MSAKPKMGCFMVILTAMLCLHGVSVCGQEPSLANATMAMENTTGREGSRSITIAKINFEEVKMPLVICIVVLLAALSKIGFHHVTIVSSRVPESCLLIVVGVILGAILHYSGLSAHLPHFFEPHEFFLYLLPPIILEASFSLHTRVVFDNLGSILTFAVIGTVLACFAVGYTMYGLTKINAMGDIQLGAVEILIFSSLIVAVDPVAVLAVFEEVGVNNVLYFMVFGESLLNDGVTVVLYNVMHEINEMDHIDFTQVLLGVVTFLVVAGGGALVGVFMALVSAVVTKYTHSVPVVEPIAVFIFAYMSFIVADTFTLSGIISMIACGVVQMKYTFRNIAPTSATTIKYFTKVLSTTTEIVIFLFLGLELITADHEFHVGFILWAIALTLIYRFIITFGLTFLVNMDRYRVRKITYQEQFVISYGGLRGAVAFSLVGLLKPGEVQSKPTFVTATLAVIIFTVFVQGITIKPLVKLFKVKMAPTEKSTLFEEVMGQMTDNIMSGMENIMGYRGNYQLKAFLEFYEDKYLKKWLLRKPQKSKEEIMRIYQKVVLRDHLKNLYASGAKIPNSPEVIRAMGRKDSVDLFSQEDNKSLQENGRIEIDMGDVTHRIRHVSNTSSASMSSRDMVRLLSNTGRNSVRRNPVEDDGPDLLHHLQDKHIRVKMLQRKVLSWYPDYDSSQKEFERHQSWQGSRQPRMSARLMARPRPLSANYDSANIPESDRNGFSTTDSANFVPNIVITVEPEINESSIKEETEVDQSPVKVEDDLRESSEKQDPEKVESANSGAKADDVSLSTTETNPTTQTPANAADENRDSDNVATTHF